MRRAAMAVIASSDVRFDNGEERPLGAKGRRTRTAIMRGAGEAFARHGWSATTITTIAEQAGVGTGTIYQYFRRKEDVLAALVGESALVELDQLRGWDPADGIESLRAVIHRFVSGYAATAPFQRVWEEASLTDPRLARLRADLSETYARLFAEAFVAGRDAGLLDPGPSPLETARALCAMVDRYCHQVFVQGAARSSAAEATALLTTLWATALGMR